MRYLLSGLAITILLTGCASVSRGEGEVYSGYTCEKSLLHFYSQCSTAKLTKEEFDTKVQSCEKELATKVCVKEQADLLWCLGRVASGTYSMSPGLYGGGGSISDGCDCSTFYGEIKKCRMQKGIFDK